MVKAVIVSLKYSNGAIGSGKAISKAFLEKGATVIATDITIPSWDDENYKGNLVRMALDVSDEKEDVASLVMYLASDMGRNINGETINLDGGVVRN